MEQNKKLSQISGVPNAVVDVLIVGGGPAGSSAAYQLAQAGFQVLVIDREAFPRQKTCGGGLTPKTIKRLPFSLAPVIERRLNRLEVTQNLSKRHLLPESGLLCAMVQRHTFDAYLLEKALEQGATFEVAGDIVEIEQTPDAVLVAFKSGRILSSKWLIAADGAKSTVRRMLHPQKVVKQAFGLEGKTPLPKGKHTISFDFFAVPWGYGWVFPKGDHANVGICTFNRTIKVSKNQLLDYCQAKLGHQQLTGIEGHPLGIGLGNGPKALGRVLFVGDAAGTVEPLLGEGIHNAILSGQMAAKALNSASTPWLVRRLYDWNMRAHALEALSCFNMHALFYRMPRLGYWWLTRPFMLKGLAHGFTRGLPLDAIVRRVLLTGSVRQPKRRIVASSSEVISLKPALVEAPANNRQ